MPDYPDKAHPPLGICVMILVILNVSCLILILILLSPCGCPGLMCPRNFVDFSAIEIVDSLPYHLLYFASFSFFSSLYFPLLFTSFLSFFLSPLCFQTGCCKRRLNLGYILSQFILCCFIFVIDDSYLVDLVVVDLDLC